MRRKKSARDPVHKVTERDAVIETVLTGEKAPCMKCGKLTDYALLDAKPDPRQLARGIPPEDCDFTVLECQSCYGPGWLPM